MPALIPWLLGALASVVGPLAARVLIALGFGVVTFSGANIVLDTLANQVKSSMLGLPAVLVQLAGMLQIDVAVNLILGAVAARIALASLTKIKLG